MTRTLEDYFGRGANTDGNEVVFYLNMLIEELEPRKNLIVDARDNDTIVAILLAYLHKKSFPPTDNNGISLIDPSIGIISELALPRSKAVDRKDERQIEHKLIFNVYTKDFESFPIDRVV